MSRGSKQRFTQMREDPRPEMEEALKIIKERPGSRELVAFLVRHFDYRNFREAEQAALNPKFVDNLEKLHFWRGRVEALREIKTFLSNLIEDTDVRRHPE